MSPPANTPSSIFFEQGETLLWIEVVRVPFSRSEISDFLTKTRQIQSRFSRPLSGILVAPDFETGIQELMELVKIPIRLFKYREEASLEGWLEEITVSHNRERQQSEDPPTPHNRLNREELREFIQLEIDDASGKYKS